MCGCFRSGFKIDSYLCFWHVSSTRPCVPGGTRVHAKTRTDSLTFMRQYSSCPFSSVKGILKHPDLLVKRLLGPTPKKTKKQSKFTLKLDREYLSFNHWD